MPNRFNSWLFLSDFLLLFAELSGRFPLVHVKFLSKDTALDFLISCCIGYCVV